MLRFIGGAVLLVLCTSGYAFILLKKTKVDKWLVPSIVFTSMTAVMYLGGLLNIMPLTTYLIIAGGAWGLLKYSDTKISIDFKHEIIPILFCLFLFIYLIYYWAGAIYPDGDTLTHWGVIVREMAETGRFPNFTTKWVTYHSYPTGTASWIHFVIRLFGSYSESLALSAQGIWIFSCGIAVFSLNTDRNKISDVLLSLFIIWILFYTGGIDNLQVDNMLSLLVIACICVLMEGKKRMNSAMLLSMPFLFVLPIIKNSGILFSAFLIPLYLWFYAQNYKGAGKILKRLGCIMICSFSSLFLWQAHIAMVYENANASRHSFSIASIKEIAESRPFWALKLITKRFLATWFSWNASFEWLCNIAFLMTTIAICILVKSSKKTALSVFSLTFTCYLAYKIGLLGMYLFNMPGDAASLPSYNRYQTTFSTLVFFLIVAEACFLVQKRKASFQMYALAAVICGCFIYCAGYAGFGKLNRPDYAADGTYRQLVTYIKSNAQVLHEGQKALLYAHDTFAYFYSRFAFHLPNAWSTNDLELLDNTLRENGNQYDLVIIWDRDEEVVQLLEQYGFDEDTEIIFLQK